MRLQRLAVAIALCVAAPLLAQSADSVVLRGASGQRRVVRAAELAAMPRHDVRASAHTVTGNYTGVALRDLLRLVGAPPSDSLRGAALAAYIVVEGLDGYRVTFSIAEADSGFTDRIILLADRKDGAPLSARDGAFQLIVPGEKRPGRWVRQVTRISLVRAPREPA